METAKRQIEKIEKEWGGPVLLQQMQTSESVCQHVSELIVTKQIEDPLVVNVLHNPKKNKQAQKLDGIQVKKMLLAA